MSAAGQLCPQCGLCCNGVLFGDVELQRGDPAALLASKGIAIFRKERKQAFVQPCACLVGGLCNIYADRPRQCRAFECAQLRRVDGGQQSLSVALRKIQAAKKLSAEVARLCHALGQRDETMPLNRRYAAVMAEPMDLAGSERELELRGELMLAVGRLVEMLERDFLVMDGGN